MDKTKIGFTAGDIFHLLKKNGKMSLKEIVNNIDAEQTTVVMSIGWLAREDKIEFFNEGKKNLIKLKEIYEN